MTGLAVWYGLAGTPVSVVCADDLGVDEGDARGDPVLELRLLGGVGDRGGQRVDARVHDRLGEIGVEQVADRADETAGVGVVADEALRRSGCWCARSSPG